MITLGLYGDERTSAAAVAIGGRLVSAIRVTDLQEGPAARRMQVARARALQVAGVSPQDLDETVTAGGCPHERAGAEAPAPTCVDRLVALAAQLRAGLAGDVLVVALDDDHRGDGALVRVTPSSVTRIGSIDGARDLLRAMSRVAEVVGINAEQPFASLHLLAGADPDPGEPLSGVFRTDGSAVRTDFERLEHALQAVQADCPADLASGSTHLRVERGRRALADGIARRAAEALGRIASHAAREEGVQQIAFTGASCTSPSFAGHLSAGTPGARFAPVTESIGAAIGAALLPHPDPLPLSDLAMGPAFTDDEVKAVLDNCRLEYVYEPAWTRLHLRVSQLLKNGALVGWFQGRSDFGGDSLGNRSVLSDPSGRYARENVNVYLLRRQLTHELPLSLSSSAAAASGFTGDAMRFVPANGSLLDAWRQPLAGALHAHGRVLVHVPSVSAAPELARLLEVHREQTGIPGLINVPLMAGDVPAATPRDAIRSMFGSPVDVLVIGRFLVSKDYWMIRRP